MNILKKKLFLVFSIAYEIMGSQFLHVWSFFCKYYWLPFSKNKQAMGDNFVW